MRTTMIVFAIATSACSNPLAPSIVQPTTQFRVGQTTLFVPAPAEPVLIVPAPVTAPGGEEAPPPPPQSDGPPVPTVPHCDTRKPETLPICRQLFPPELFDEVPHPIYGVIYVPKI